MMSLRHIPNALPGETVELFLRRHWIDLLKALLVVLLMIAAPILLLAALIASGNNPWDSMLWGTLTTILLSSYAFMILIVTMTNITDYWLDVWIVTSERIVSIEQLGLFRRVVAEVHLNQVQDITSETLGFLETLFSFGDVFIQTAATRERFQFKNVDNPDKIKEHLIRLTNTCKNHHHHDPSF